MKTIIKSENYLFHHCFEIFFSLALLLTFMATPVYAAEHEENSWLITHFTLIYSDEDYDAQLGQVDFDDLMPQHYLMNHTDQENQEYIMQENAEAF